MTLLPWKNPKLLQPYLKGLAERKELSRSLIKYNMDQQLFSTLQTRKRTPDFSSHLYSETDVLLREVGGIFSRLGEAVDVHVVDLYKTNFYTVAPLIFEFLDKEMWYAYTVVAPGKATVRQAGENARSYALERGVESLQVAEISADVTLGSVDLLLEGLVQRDRQHTGAVRRVFTLLDSALSNVLDGRIALRNIYDSMQKGDYFLLSMRLYVSGMETQAMTDYAKLLSGMHQTHLQAESLFEESVKEFWWDENPGVRGVRFGVRTVRDELLEELPISKGELLTLYKNVYYTKGEVEDLLRDTGFDLQAEYFGSGGRAGIFLLQK